LRPRPLIRRRARSTRLASDFVQRGSDDFGLPSGYSAEVIAPLGQPGADHLKNILCPVLWRPSDGIRTALDKRFSSQALYTELFSRLLTDAEIDRFSLISCKHELWLRLDTTAAQMCPADIPPYVDPKNAAEAEVQQQTREEAEADKRRRARTKAASGKSADGMKFNRQAEADYGKQRLSELERERKAK
jgi:hypothetical protein